ncbi:MAG: heterodisulfide reductase subunit B [Chloroflexi bacterium RBG_16_48_7]|nr:MAG: heterodisulfide reductase subunit B [Chloroflexi bacterium RBG_16_48_7]
MKYVYYPGCSGTTTAAEYNQSAIAVCKTLGIELAEMPDWNCCGATSAHSTNYALSHALSGRNLAIAEKQGLDIAVICPSCYSRLKDTQNAVKHGKISSKAMEYLIEKPYEAKSDVRHLLDLVTNVVGLDTVKSLVKKPLKGLRVVCYYGCYLVRPPELTGFDNTENPTSMDRLMESLGAEAVDWRGKVECCGGSLSLTDREKVQRLSTDIAGAAIEVNADVIVTACGLCQSNLESRQKLKKPVPAIYFTELMGLAFGLDPEPWFKKHLVDPHKVLKEHNLLG